MKKLTDPSELRKALEAANLIQYVMSITGEIVNENNLNLPYCEVGIDPRTPPEKQQAIEIIVEQQAARDWKTIISDEKQRLEAIDADNKESVLQQVANMTNEEYNTWWGARTAVQKDAILKRILRIICRRLL